MNLQLKALATVDDRFSVAAMQYDGDKPTYKVSLSLGAVIFSFFKSSTG